MSALGHKRTFAVQNGMSALPSRADICSATRDVCFGPKADVENGVASPINKPTYSQGQDWGDTEVFQIRVILQHLLHVYLGTVLKSLDAIDDELPSLQQFDLFRLRLRLA